MRRQLQLFSADLAYLFRLKVRKVLSRFWNIHLGAVRETAAATLAELRSFNLASQLLCRS
jgi:hypothetical protein